MLDVQRLTVLREFAHQGTVAKAAASLSFTPSAVSQQLAQLQREAGVQLFRREGRRLELTDAARLLLERGEAVIDQLQSIEAELAAQAGAVSGVVKVAAFQTAAQAIVVPAAVSLATRFADLEVQLIEAEAEEAIPALERRDLDVVVAEEYANAPRPRRAGIARRDIATDELLIAMPADHPRAGRRRSIKLDALAAEPWVMARAGTAYADMAVGLCRSVGRFEPVIRHRANDLRLMLDAVARLGVVAIVPALGQPHEHPGVVTRRIGDGTFARTIFVATRESDAVRPATAAVVGAIAT